MSQWNDEIVRAMMILAQHHKPRKVTELINKQFGTDFTYHAVRAKINREKGKEVVKTITTESRIAKNYEPGKLFTEKELLEIHGYDPSEFAIDHGLSNEWQVTNKDGQAYYNFQSRIKVKPRLQVLNPKEIGEMLASYREPFYLEPLEYVEHANYLLIPIPDPHFGPNKASDYQQYQDGLLELMEDNYKEIIFCHLGDFFDADNVDLTTRKGTQMEQDYTFLDMFEEGTLFLEPLLQKAIKVAKKVRYIYTCGNHDESSGLSYVWHLSKTYPQIEFSFKDDAEGNNEFYNCFEFGNNAILLHHGTDARTPNQLKDVFSNDYPEIWGRAKNVEAWSAHLHHKLEDGQGRCLYRRLKSPSHKTGRYEKRNKYAGTVRGMEAFIFTEDKWKATINL